MKIRIDQIKILDGRRPVDNSIAIKLSKSIKELGLLNPITISKDNILIAGHIGLRRINFSN